MQEMNKEKQSFNFSKNKSNSMLIKGALVIILILVMSIPVPFISGLINERNKNQQDVIMEVSKKWGGEQTIYGPFLEIPITGEEYKLYVSPKEMNIKGEIFPEKRKRGIYEVMLYKSELKIEAVYDSKAEIKKHIKYSNIEWENAKVLFSLTDLKGLEANILLSNNEKKVYLEPDNQSQINVLISIEQGSKKMKTLSAFLKLSEETETKITLPIQFKGTQKLNFIPIAKTTSASIETTWGDLKADGSFLPNTSESIEGKRKIDWSILQSSRSLDHYWFSAQSLDQYKFGVNLLQTNDYYVKVDRSVKYALLFIALPLLVSTL